MVELGSGPGLGALIAARWAQSVLLTDYQDLVMDLIRINIKRCNPRPEMCKLSCAKLDWTQVSEPGYFEGVEVCDSDQTSMGSLEAFRAEVLIGTDVVYWRSFIVPFCNTLDRFFALNPSLVFYICYIERHKITHIELLAELEKRSYTVVEIGQSISKKMHKLSFIYEIKR